jgi:hypothetical protein
VSTHLNNDLMRGSLHHQIRVAAGQVAEHRKAVRFRSAALGERLHASLTSPDMLLFAFGTGFVIAEFTPQAGPARDSKNLEKSNRRPLARRVEQTLRLALKMYTLAHAANTALAAGPHEILNAP